MSLIRNHWIKSFVLGAGTGLVLASCSDDEKDSGTGPSHGGEAGETSLAVGGDPPRGGSNGTAGSDNTTASGGTQSGGTTANITAGTSSISGGNPSTGGTSFGGGGASTDRNVFRPTRVPATAERVATLKTNPGFRISVFAGGLERPRMLASHGEHIYVTRPFQNDVVMLSDANGDGVADSVLPAVSNLESVHGIAFRGTSVYLATVTSVYRATVQSDGTFGPLTAILTDLPPGGQHPHRTLGIGPDDHLYISVGSSCDACAETDPDYATLLRTRLDGGERSIFATGLRNTIGFAWRPVDNTLWGMDQGSDWRGNDLPPEELNRIDAQGHYGWPFCFSKRVIDPIIQDPPEGTKATLCAASIPPVLELQAHGSPIQLAFYQGTLFPAEYRGDLFLALHGSWNRYPPTGYKVVRIRFDVSGTPVAFEDFVTGFLSDDGATQFGRPAGIVVASDGSLIISDDDNGNVYRVRYDVP